LLGAGFIDPEISPTDRQECHDRPTGEISGLAISANGSNYRGSATALSPYWALTAGHNLDFDDGGSPDAGLSIGFHLPGFGVFTASAFYTCPGFTGFGSPSSQLDLGLVYFEQPLPLDLFFPLLNSNVPIGGEVALVGFGRSGYGSYGYTTSASLTDRRVGWNVVDTFTRDDLRGGFNAVLRYDFDAPSSFGLPGGSLGNERESLIGPGDSGGPILVNWGGAWGIVGVSTFIEGYGGRFGDRGGGVVLAPYLDRLQEQGAAATCDCWLGVWRDFLKILERSGVRSIAEFDEKLRGTQFVSNWLQDLDIALSNASARRPEYHRQRRQWADEFLQHFGGHDREELITRLADLYTTKRRAGPRRLLACTNTRQGRRRPRRSWAKTNFA